MKPILIMVIVLGTFWIIAKTQLWIIALPAWALADHIAKQTSGTDFEQLWGWGIGIAAVVGLVSIL